MGKNEGQAQSHTVHLAVDEQTHFTFYFGPSLHTLPLPTISFFLELAKSLLEANEFHDQHLTRNSYFTAQTKGHLPIPGVVYQSPAMKNVAETIHQISSSKIPVLITGETGTGKELVARAIHAKSNRADKPFIPLNCAAVPETTFESQLFGHRRGTFTGATENSSGVIREAEGGTLFLDEISELPMPLGQLKLAVAEFAENYPQKLSGSDTELRWDILAERAEDNVFWEDWWKTWDGYLGVNANLGLPLTTLSVFLQDAKQASDAWTVTKNMKLRKTWTAADCNWGAGLAEAFNRIERLLGSAYDINDCSTQAELPGRTRMTAFEYRLSSKLVPGTNDDMGEHFGWDLFGNFSDNDGPTFNRYDFPLVMGTQVLRTGHENAWRLMYENARYMADCGTIHGNVVAGTSNVLRLGNTTDLTLMGQYLSCYPQADIYKGSRGFFESTPNGTVPYNPTIGTFYYSNYVNQALNHYIDVKRELGTPDLPLEQWQRRVANWFVNGENNDPNRKPSRLAQASPFKPLRSLAF